MKKTLLIAVLTLSAYFAMGQAHDARYNFDYITYADGNSPYNPEVPTDNSHFTGYFDIGFAYWVFFPNDDCRDAYSFPVFSYVSVDARPVKMQAQYISGRNTFVIYPFGKQFLGQETKIISYRKTKDGGVGQIILP